MRRSHPAPHRELQLSQGDSISHGSTVLKMCVCVCVCAGAIVRVVKELYTWCSGVLVQKV